MSAAPHRSGPVIRLLEAFIAFCLVAMVVMVFGNVVLRYGFGSGLVMSEELSRFAFIWLVFVGAVVAMHEGAHLGVDTVVTALPRSGRVACLVVSELLILACCAMFFWGTWRQHEVNATTAAQVTGMSMIWVFGMGYFTSVGIALVTLRKLWLLATGRLSDDQLIGVHESEEALPPATSGGRP
ncbi:MAG: TRAP transporter small permease [Hydrogenophaga sp.]|jgi:TRAP-type C4-dicarboxylate transport system permease small subunit|uniref:TRAP transporter small permease n=1 Tax=Hydrogenophaga sp. TaxID=1904254 RepID=UPI001DA67F58|nr:TRAP transporter small permease [Hydrogenophaga sp.]MBW0170474.1 TRAP transporter small permease [Hydrogenophaga sp.]MBW0186256.1 TRAP transporter small permease [Hydrogenophaga sp.]